jgi:hypothetical protein
MSLLNQREAADFLRLSQRTLERFRLTGDGPPYVKAGRRVAYRPEDLDRWIGDRVRLSTSEGRAA